MPELCTMAASLLKQSFQWQSSTVQASARSGAGSPGRARAGGGAEPARAGARSKAAGSARKEELLERAYSYVLAHGLAGMSLRPLAAAIDSSPRVLLFLFGSKEGLIRALLARARADELALLAGAGRHPGSPRTGGSEWRPGSPPIAGGESASALRTTWQWLAAEPHRQLLNLWLEAYARSLADPGGPWAGFARQTVTDWLGLLWSGDQTDTTLALAVLRGALLDLLATGEKDRVTAAVERYLTLAGAARRGKHPEDGPADTMKHV
jgi:AcrR family transcriptional regulator